MTPEFEREEPTFSREPRRRREPESELGREPQLFRERTAPAHANDARARLMAERRDFGAYSEHARGPERRSHIGRWILIVIALGLAAGGAYYWRSSPSASTVAAPADNTDFLQPKIAVPAQAPKPAPVAAQQPTAPAPAATPALAVTPAPAPPAPVRQQPPQPQAIAVAPPPVPVPVKSEPGPKAGSSSAPAAEEAVLTQAPKAQNGSNTVTVNGTSYIKGEEPRALGTFTQHVDVPPAAAPAQMPAAGAPQRLTPMPAEGYKPVEVDN